MTYIIIFLFAIAMAAAVLAWTAFRNAAANQQRLEELEKLVGEIQSAAAAEPQLAQEKPAEPVVIEAPVAPKPAPALPAEKKHYLSKAAQNGVFSRCSDDFELGNSLFLLTEKSGQGSFSVIVDADVHQLALLMPTDNLLYACQGDDLQRPNGRKTIVTDAPGSAKLENGAWVVTRKAKIHYE